MRRVRNLGQKQKHSSQGWSRTNISARLAPKNSLGTVPAGLSIPLNFAAARLEQDGNHLQEACSSNVFPLDHPSSSGYKEQRQNDFKRWLLEGGACED